MSDVDSFAYLLPANIKEDFEVTQMPNYRYCLKREMSTQTEKPKKGRKPKEGVKKGNKKTEEKDKFWLRAFRTCMKGEFLHFKTSLTPSERSFWREYLSSEGQPERSLKYSLHRFRSYGKQYKDYLFGHPSFSARFRDWLNLEGLEELERKYPQDRNRDTHRMLREYAYEVLAVYDTGKTTETDSLIAQMTDAVPR